MSRQSNDEFRNGKLYNGFDYANQAWVVNGKYVRCGHLETMNCGCFGKDHAGDKPRNGGAVVNCNQCEAAMINGVFCHETGCPNSRKTWVPERGEWVLFHDCFECGYPVEVGTACDCQIPDGEE